MPALRSQSRSGAFAPRFPRNFRCPQVLRGQDRLRHPVHIHRGHFWLRLDLRLRDDPPGILPRQPRLTRRKLVNGKSSGRTFRGSFIECKRATCCKSGRPLCIATRDIVNYLILTVFTLVHFPLYFFPSILVTVRTRKLYFLPLLSLVFVTFNFLVNVVTFFQVLDVLSLYCT